MQALNVRGWQTDYVVARRRHDLQAPQACSPLVFKATAKLGQT